MRGLHVQNLTNLYTKTNANKIRGDFKRILQQSRDGICGIEINANRGSIDFTLISPSFLKRSGIVRGSNKNQLSEDSLFLDGYLNQPFFMPICPKLDGEFIERVQSLPFILKDNESVFIQWLFKRTFNWQEKAIEMYSSYILGNDYPLTFNIGRKFQEKMVNLTSKLGVLVEVRDYIEEAEQKIASEGYCFKLNAVVDCSIGRQEYIVNRLKEILNQYTFYNNIKLSEIKSKNLLQEIQDCVMTHDAKYQILSKREILSLIGGNDELDEVEEEVVSEGIKVNSNESGLIVKDAIELLPDYPIQEVVEREGILQEIAEALKRVGITSQARVYNGTVTTGVRLTSVSFDIPKGVNLTHLTSKQKDIQAVLGVESLSIEQGIKPDSVKFLIPNENPAVVGLRSLLEMESFKKYSEDNPLAFVAGVDEINNPIMLSLSKLSHLLVAGATNSGKSVFINALAVTLMLTNSPQKLSILMIDPKLVEMQHFIDMPHVESVITDMDEANTALKKLTDEMDNRYSIFKDAGVKNISLYNDKVIRGQLGKNVEVMKYICVFIDEYADLRDTNPEVEEHVIRLAQKARACGIHLVLCSQRPSSDIVNSRIKANLPNAISFNLNNNNNYKTVFGHGINGVNLLGRGDGIMKTSQSPNLKRFQSPIISPNESEEERVYTELADFLNGKYRKYKGSKKQTINMETNEEDELVDEDEGENDDLNKLKQIIADTKISKSSELRSIMGVKNTTMTNLMKKLVEEGFLEAGKTRQEGYRINEEKLNEWLEKNTPQSN